MSDVIRLLPDSVANQIAAGEVIQRPASVIKELVENAVDAGAHNIKIILRDGGKNLIQVIDDGCGMSDTDARMAFERHATSKIKDASDLFDLHTMGFRGEALPSIAAVAQIELKTMRKGDTIGTRLQLAASKFESQEADACPAGTNLAVKNLFFNFPARRKFLKKDSVELSHIVHEFERLTLVNPDKEFLLVHNDVTLHQLLPGSLKQRVVGLFGKALEKQLIPIFTETSLVKISGLVSLPENTRKRNQLQYFFVNGRNMRHPYFQKAVLHCYENLIPADHQPNFFINFEVDPATIDVNIHPTKSEIKFENEAPIWQILVAAIKEALGKYNGVPGIDFDTADAIDIPVFNPVTTPMFSDVPGEDYNPFASSPDDFLKPDKKTGEHSVKAPSALNLTEPENEIKSSSALNDWDRLYRDFQNATKSGNQIPDPTDFTSPKKVERSALNNDNEPEADDPHTSLLPDMEVCESSGLLRFRNRIMVAPAARGLMIIDRYRAHLKVLYEKFIEISDSVLSESQQLLFPETVTLTVAQNVTLGSMHEEIRHLGFDLSFLGDNVWAINGVPAAISNLNAADTLMKMIESVADETVMPSAELKQRVALSMARAAASGGNHSLSDEEAEVLLSSFLSLPDPAYSPDGKPTFFILETSEINRRLQITN
ncbi:MAG: DNA mismatch repair endonuclease MutL [Bacteroidales bacterium]|nr:DNA mismatch repair endonuclease MutL [Bacteroidales bacterium]